MFQQTLQSRAWSCESLETGAAAAAEIGNMSLGVMNKDQIKQRLEELAHMTKYIYSYTAIHAFLCAGSQAGLGQEAGRLGASHTGHACANTLRLAPSGSLYIDCSNRLWMLLAGAEPCTPSV